MMFRKILAEPTQYGMVPDHTTETIRKELPGMCSYHSIESHGLQEFFDLNRAVSRKVDVML